MTASRPDNEAIFHAARDIPDPDRRREYVREACGGDEARIVHLEALLAAVDRTDSLLDRPAADMTDATSDQPTTESSGRAIGPYKLIEPIGEGGMGSVWMAQQTDPVRRLVAVKLIKAGMDSRQVIARFEAERQALALMDHPNIARVLDGGTTGGGRPYFVMDLVKGVPITRYCDEHHLTPRQRLELFIPVCQAVQHAHQKGIIHRDLKPSNVLVALYDGRPVPKIIDFGVAKAAGQQMTDKTLITGFGAIVGTLEYMSPEQAEINQLDIDTRSDIYALGVLLYELLTGSPPFRRKELTQAGMLEMLRVIREQEPSKPSTKLSTAEGLPTLAANRGMEPARLTKLVRGELDWIVMKALEKDRNRRYETANGFALDVQRYLADEPVLACPPSAGYRLRKFARRNRGGLAVAALVLLFLVLVGSVVGWAVRDRASREAEAARQRGERQAKVAGEVESILGEVDRLEKEQKWPEALEGARRAEAAAAVGEADPATTKGVDRRLRELEFVDRLERIRMEDATLVEGRVDNTGADRDYVRSFREYGVDIDELPVETSIDRLKARPALTVALAAALDDWVFVRLLDSEADDARWKRLVAVTRGIDLEPLRDRVRAAWSLPVSNMRDDLRRLAESIDVRAQHPATVIILARTLLRVQHPDSALRILRDAQHLHPGDCWLDSELGYILYKRRDYEGAVRFYSAALASHPSSVGVHINLGTALAARNKLDEAIFWYRRAVELGPKNAKAHYNLGNAMQAMGTLEGSFSTDAYRGALRVGNDMQAMGTLEGAIAEYRTAIDVNPTYALAHWRLGEILAAQNKLGEAVAFLGKAIEIDAKLSLPRLDHGDAFRRPGFFRQALPVFDKATELEPGNLLGWNQAAALFLYTADVERYRHACREMLDRFERRAAEDASLAAWMARTCSLAPDAVPDFARVERLAERAVTGTEKHDWYRDMILIKGLTDYRGGHPEQAVEWLRRFDLKPDRDVWDATAFAVLAMAHHRLGHAERARTALVSAHALLAKKPYAQQWPFHWLYCEILYREAEGLMGPVTLQEVVRLRPNDMAAHFRLASALAEAKEWDRSASVYAAALKRFGAPYWPGRWYEAIRSDEVFTRLTARQPEDRLPRIMRARLHVFRRDWKRAAADYARVFESLASIDPVNLLPDGGDDLFIYGCLLLLQGDRNGYEQFCKKWTDRVGDTPACGYVLARAWGVSPDPVVPAQQIVERAGKAVQADRTPWNLHVLSLAHYRNGEFKRAIERAEESNGGNWVGSAKALNWLVLAMAHSRLGQAADARQSLQRALELAGRASPVQLPGVAWPDMGPQDLVECELLRREAEELINPKSKEEPDKKSG